MMTAKPREPNAVLIRKHQMRQVVATIEELLVVDEQSNARHTSLEILELTIAKHHYWRGILMSEHGDNWNEARRNAILYIQRVHQRMRKMGAPVALKERPKGWKQARAENMEPIDVIQWFRVQKNVDKLSWKDREEIIGAIGK